MSRRKFLSIHAIMVLSMVLPGASGCKAHETESGPVSQSPTQLASTVREEAPVHPSPIAGSWYPGDPQALRSMIFGLLDKVPSSVTTDADKLVALIVPHAGYAYSGLTAAYGYKIMQKRMPKRVILLGPSHYASFHGISIGNYSAYETPLGRVAVDPAAVEELRACPLASSNPEADLQEHSLDIQIPFLQVIFDPSPPLIVPVVVGQIYDNDYAVLAACLSKLLDRDTVVVVSSDFTHYGPRFQYTPFPADPFLEKRLEVLDDGAWEEIRKGDRSGFLTYKKKSGITVCGFQPIALLLELLPEGTRAKKIFYDTSGKVTGDYSNCVSYLTIALYNPDLWGPAAAEEGTRTKGKDKMNPMNRTDSQPTQGTPTLSPPERATLIRLARDTLESCILNRKTPDPLGGAYQITALLKEDRGAFVTLKKHGELRGCIGHILPIEPLYESVRENTVNAATRDSRFSPVRPGELPEIDMEISVLSKPVNVASYRDIQIGKHGIVLKKGTRQAVFLPQVAPEQGWDLETTLRHLSMKAGLDPQAWKDPQARFSVFTAEIIEEER